MRPLLLLVVLAATGALDCREATQITIRLSTDEDCSSGITTNIETGITKAIAPRATTSACAQGGFIGSLVVVPKENDDEHVMLQVNAAVGVPIAECTPPAFGKNCIVARRSISFAPHTPLTLPIALRQACRGVACGADETCVAGSCRLAAIDSSLCTGADGCAETALATRGDVRPDAGVTPPPPPTASDAGADPVPEPLYFGTFEIDSIAIDADTIYAPQGSSPEFGAHDGTIIAVPKAGGSARTLVSDLDAPATVAVNATQVYWLEAQQIRSVGKSGGAATTVPIAGGGPGPTPLALHADDASIYWATSGNVVRANLDGSSPTTLGTSSGLVYALTLAPDGFALASRDASDNGEVKRYLTGDANPSFLATTSNFLVAVVPRVAISGHRIAWSDGAQGGVVMYNSGAQTSTLASAQDAIFALVADAEGIYWIHGIGRQTSLETSTWDGQRKTLLTGLYASTGLALDADYVYYSQIGNPSPFPALFRLRRRP